MNRDLEGSIHDSGGREGGLNQSSEGFMHVINHAIITNSISLIEE